MRLTEIEQRMAAIAEELRDTEIPTADLERLTTEVENLRTERTALLAANEQRSKLLASIAEGTQSAATVRNFSVLGAAQPEERDMYDTVEYRKAFMAHVTRGTAIPAEYRADAITATTDVSAVIPTTVLNKIVEKMESTGMILPLVTRTAYKGGVTIPTSATKPTATWVAEGYGSDKQKKTTGSITFAYHKLRCSVAVTLETDTIALTVFESTFIANVVEAMTKTLEQAIISGTGIGQPTGILAATVETGQALECTAPSFADLIAAEAALPLAYENGAVWCMTKKTFMAFAGITDEVGQPIGRVNYGIGGKPERTLLGRNVVLCDYLPSYSASLEVGEIFAFLFNFKDYTLNSNLAMTVKKYEDNDTDDVVTKAVLLVDGKVVDNGSLVTIAKKA